MENNLVGSGHVACLTQEPG